MDLNEAQIETIGRIRANSASPADEYEATEHDDGALVRFDNGSGYVLDGGGAIVAHADEAADDAETEPEDETEAETEETEE